MFGIRTRAFTGLTLLATTCGLTGSAEAQLFPWFNSCGTCQQATVMPVQQMVAAPAMVQSAAVSNCPCMKPVTETVYQDVQKVEYQPVQKVVKAAKVVTVMEDQPVTTYQTVNEARTVEVPTYVAQQVTEMQPVTINQSYWQTQWQPVPKYTPCAYDNRPGLMGEMNRMGYAFRNTFTPNYVARREFVPNVVASEVAVTRTVQIPTTRQVTYNVSKMVPMTTTQKVPVQRMVWEDQTVTAMVPVTTTQRVAVGTQTRMVYSGDLGVTASAAEPVPTAAKQDPNTSANKGSTRLQSAPSNEIPLQNPTYRRDAAPAQDAAPAVNESPITATSADSVIRVAGWRATRRPAGEEAASGPAISVVQK
ncbi:hypothetical protein [Planctomicrobium piriforme]|uniref:YTV protein n=1 Tax=Planctomicrobium piriforme TaxID=1576369 RepID=A0A1I3D342_9PLAN|nr:hypothetical protein [Planctomicrobium piriforme]SFH81107.1 hypothetical protein SAMN05421753_10371 [Planctomicrobium piriforme]